jgi:cytoskeletal protein CcmA (bactofilin family)
MLNNKKAKSQRTTDTLIGDKSRVEGKIISQASLRIEGQVTGDIECAGDITIGAAGIAYSNISAQNVYNAGTIHGSVTTKEKLTIANTGKVFGSIAVGTLNITEGGIFQGISKMNSTSPSSKEEAQDLKPLLHKIETPAAAAN